MHYYLIALGIVSGICFAFGILFVFMGLRREGTDMVHFTFGLFAVAYAGAVLTGMLMYGAAALPEYLAIDRWSGVFAGATYIFLIWFVATYTDVQPLPVLAVLTILFATVIAAHITRPTLIHGEIMGVAFATLPWGEGLAFLDAAASNWETLFLITQLLTILFLYYACIRQYRRGERAAAGALGAGLFLFVAALVIDMLVESGAINFVLTSDFGFLPLAIVMGLRLSGDTIRTEEEVAHYRRRLELLVEDRTADLTRANEQLESEVVERTRAEETLSHRVEELASLSRIAQTLASVAELPDALEQVSRMVADLFAARYAFIVLRSGEECQLHVLVGFQRGAGSIGMTPLTVPLTEMEYFHRVLTQAESLALTGVQSLPLAEPMREFVARRRIQCAMLIPLIVRGRAIGLMAVATDQAGQAFTAGQVRLAETIAGDAAAAVENARLSEQAQAAAVSEERSRLARELHDSVTQILFSINLIALSLGRLWKRNPEMAARSTDELQRLTRGALAEMRTLLRELRPQTIAVTELSTLLKQLSDGVSARHDIPVDVEVGTACEIPPEVHVALYRIAQEALSNVAKHAEASQVAIRLASDDTSVQLSIIDDGQGFDPSDVPAEHMGLAIMQERADAIGAAVTIASRPGAGTSIVVAWPIHATGGDSHAEI